MNIKLKNVKHLVFSSNETECFEAAIYINNKKAGFAHNSGQGGSTNITPYATYQIIENYAKTLPKIDLYAYSVSQSNNFNELGGDSSRFMDQDADIFINTLLSQHLQEKHLKKLCKKQVLFRKPNTTYQDNEYDVINLKFSLEVKNKIIAKYGVGTTFLNS